MLNHAKVPVLPLNFFTFWFHISVRGLPGPGQVCQSDDQRCFHGGFRQIYHDCPEQIRRGVCGYSGECHCCVPQITGFTQSREMFLAICGTNLVFSLGSNCEIFLNNPNPDLEYSLIEAKTDVFKCCTRFALKRYIPLLLSCSRVNACMEIYIILTLCLILCLIVSRSVCTVTERESLRRNQPWPLKQSSLPNSPLRSLSPRPSLLIAPPPPLLAPPLPRQQLEEGWRVPLLPGGSRKLDSYKWGRNVFSHRCTCRPHKLFLVFSIGANIKSIQWNGANTLGVKLESRENPDSYNNNNCNGKQKNKKMYYCDITVWKQKKKEMNKIKYKTSYLNMTKLEMSLI